MYGTYVEEPEEGDSPDEEDKKDKLFSFGKKSALVYLDFAALHQP